MQLSFLPWARPRFGKGVSFVISVFLLMYSRRWNEAIVHPKGAAVNNSLT
jgi:hypothetical protein